MSSYLSRADIGRCIIFALLLSAVCVLTSCSLFRASKSKSLPLPAELTAAELRFDRISDDPFLYKVSIGNQEKRAYATAISECGIYKTTPATATTRQLFVGFSDLKLQNQENVDMDGKFVLRSKLTATLDNQPVRIVCNTVRRGACVTDLLVWSFDSNVENSDQSFSEAFSDDALASLSRLAGNLG